MPPIQLHANSAISTTAAKASGQPQTPKSPAQPYSPTRVNTDLPTSPTTPSTFDFFQSARPGAVPFPGPTSPAVPAPTQSTPSPTRTIQAPAYDGPPLPQPGAAPTPSRYAPANPFAFSSNSPTTTGPSVKTPLPPPPKAGERRASTAMMSPATTAAPQPPFNGNGNYTTNTNGSNSPTYGYPSATGYPPQATIPAPGMNYTPTKSTIPTTTPSNPSQYSFQAFGGPSLGPPSQPQTPRAMSFAYGSSTFGTVASAGNSGAATPTWLPAPSTEVADVFRKGSLEHPPGYVQDPRAGEMTAAQRAAQQARAQEESYLPTLGGVTDGLIAGVGGGGGSSSSADGSGSGGGSVGFVGKLSAEGRRGSTLAFEALGNVTNGVNGEVVGENVGKAWGAAKKWMGAAAGAVGEMEGEMWRRVGGK